MSGTVYPRQLVVLYHAVAPPNTHPILDRDMHVLRPEVFLANSNGSVGFMILRLLTT